MFINHNLAAMNSQRHVFNTNKVLDKSLERLSSGLKINSGADDASGLAISEKMSAQISGLSVANQNAQDGQALFKIAEGALAQVTSMLTRMEELAVRATNGTLTDTDRIAITDEVKELRDQINQISKTTEYNTLKVLNGSLAISATISGDGVTLLNKPFGVRSGDVSFHLTQRASAAVVQGTQVTQATLSMGVTSSGVINVNGSDIAINAGDSIGAVVGKINAVNDQTKVVATLNAAKDQIILTSGILDEDAKHITTANLLKLQNASQPIVGYALMGEQYSITVAGGSMLSSIGLTATSVSGANAAGSINGVAMKSAGTTLENVEFASVAYGMKLDTDTYLGGKGTYIRNYADMGSSSHIMHKLAGSIGMTIKVNTEKTLKLQIGANYNQSIFNGLDSIATNQLGIGGSSRYLSLEDISLDTVQNANYSLKTIQKAITDVTKMRSKIGAMMNRLDYTISTLSIQRENMTAALSRIQDADISEEMTKFTKQQIMLQAGTAMLSQANARPQSVLQLLG